MLTTQRPAHAGARRMRTWTLLTTVTQLPKPLWRQSVTQWMGMRMPYAAAAAPWRMRRWLWMLTRPWKEPIDVPSGGGLAAARRTTVESADMPDVVKWEARMEMLCYLATMGVIGLIHTANSEGPLIRLRASAIDLRRVRLSRSPEVKTHRHTVLAPRAGTETESAVPPSDRVALVLGTLSLLALMRVRVVALLVLWVVALAMSGWDGGTLTPRRFVLASGISIAWTLVRAREPLIPRRDAEHAHDLRVSAVDLGLPVRPTARTLREAGYKRGNGRPPGCTCRIKERPLGMNRTIAPNAPRTEGA